MDEVYRLFDRRCRTDTALAELVRLRRHVRRYRSLGRALDKLNSPNLEKALTFLDDRLMPSTSNAVERSNRRHRKMQKSSTESEQRPTWRVGWLWTCNESGKPQDDKRLQRSSTSSGGGNDSPSLLQSLKYPG
jgi:hypothetical protein